MKVVGIDPGLSSTGVGIIQGNGLKVDCFSFGSIETSKNTPLPGRLDNIYSGLISLLQKEQPDLLVIEDVFSLKKYPRSGITLGQVSGVILLAGFRAGVRAIQVPVREAKQVLTGNGNADKRQMEQAVRHQLNLKNRIQPDHASDALGMALIGLYRYAKGIS